jgi:hypothetical protein
METSERMNREGDIGRLDAANTTSETVRTFKRPIDRSVSFLNVAEACQPKCKKKKCLSTDLLEPVVHIPNEKAALDRHEVFFDLKPRWRKASTHKLQESQNTSDMVLLRPDEDFKTALLLIDEYDGSEQPHFRDEDLLRSPTFRPSLGNKYISYRSPCTVNSFEQGKKVYFWHRSMAWTDDGEEEAPSKYIAGDFCQHLSVPERLGKDSTEESTHTVPTTKKLAMDRRIRRRPQSTFSSHEVKSNKVTPIHWEEKVVDAIYLKEFANLKL